MSVGVSDAELSESAFVAGGGHAGDGAFATAGRHHLDSSKRPVRLASIGTMHQHYKGFSDLLKAVAICSSEKLDLELTLVGDGPLRPQFEQQADSLGIREHVRFVGQLPAGQAVRDELDQADIYVQPSLVEGLPRALVEAMGRGCPCIATMVGGVPELLPAEFLVAPRRPAQLAAAIKALACDPARLREAGIRNIEVARTFSEDALAPRRLAFQRAVIASHQAWLERQRKAG
jgi:glycosyltransferase involved in cell wall biosynthesis